MHNYHNYISQITGIKCDFCFDAKLVSFCNILYNHFFFFQTYNLNNNIFNYVIEENILRKELLIYLKNEIDNNNNITSILNIILLLIQIIHDKYISEELMDLMNVKKNIVNKIKFKDNKNIYDLNTLKKENILENNIKNNNNKFQYMNNSEIPDSINKLDYYKLNSEIANNNSQYILINNNKLYFKDLIFDNNFFSSIKTLFNLVNNNNELIITIINFLFSSKFNLKSNHVIICFNLIENLISDSFQLKDNQNSNQILNILDFYYLETLKQIKDILFKNNNDLNNDIFKYSYKIFEECFNLNKKDIKEIINNYYSELQLESYIILESNYDEKLKLKYFFQKFISLHDLLILLNSHINNNNLLFKNISFPLDLIKNKLFNIGGKINLKEYGINTIEVNFYINNNDNNNLNKKEEKLIMFIYNNYLFFALSPENIYLYDINALDGEELSFIKYKYPLRNINLNANTKNNELLFNFINKNDIKFEIILKFQNNIIYNKGKELIINGKNYSIILEYTSISNFINKNLVDYYKIYK